MTAGVWPMPIGPVQAASTNSKCRTRRQRERGGTRGEWRHVEPGICSLQTGSEHASSGSQLLSQDNDDDEDNDRLQRQDSAGAGAPLVRLGISALRLQRKDININEPL